STQNATPAETSTIRRGLRGGRSGNVCGVVRKKFQRADALTTTRRAGVIRYHLTRPASFPCLRWSRGSSRPPPIEIQSSSAFHRPRPPATPHSTQPRSNPTRIGQIKGRDHTQATVMIPNRDFRRVSRKQRILK